MNSSMPLYLLTRTRYPGATEVPPTKHAAFFDKVIASETESKAYARLTFARVRSASQHRHSSVRSIHLCVPDALRTALFHQTSQLLEFRKRHLCKVCRADLFKDSQWFLVRALRSLQPSN